MAHHPQILVCDDDSLFHLAVRQALRGKFECRSAYNTDEAVVILRNNNIDVMLLDIQMRTPDEGLRVLPRFRTLDPALPIIMLTGVSDFQTVREAMRLGATDYMVKDLEQNDLIHNIGRVLEKKSLLDRNGQQNFELAQAQRRHVLVGQSPAIQALRKTIERIRASNANVVITGETGTGKEVVARQLRKTLPDGTLEPFVAIDSSTIQSTMAESALFGHERGAFTGAERQIKGVFEEANGGVVYFDEISNMPLEIQAKLLRVLQEKEVIRLGSNKVMKLEFRVICATNKNLEEMAADGRFKDDLLQRLNVLPVQLPPLRERLEDIPLLAEHFLKHQGDLALTFSDDAVSALQSYSWPGNIRELGNLVSYVVAMTEGTEVTLADLPPKFRDTLRHRFQAKPDEAASVSDDFYAQVAEFEKALLTRKYAELGGNVSRMALTLGMDRSHLYTKLREFGIHFSKEARKR